MWAQISSNTTVWLMLGIVKLTVGINFYSNPSAMKKYSYPLQGSLNRIDPTMVMGEKNARAATVAIKLMHHPGAKGADKPAKRVSQPEVSSQRLKRNKYIK